MSRPFAIKWHEWTYYLLLKVTVGKNWRGKSKIQWARPETPISQTPMLKHFTRDLLTGARGAAQPAQPVCQGQGRPSSPTAAGDGFTTGWEKETEKRGIMGEMPCDPQNSNTHWERSTHYLLLAQNKHGRREWETWILNIDLALIKMKRNANVHLLPLMLD